MSHTEPAAIASPVEQPEVTIVIPAYNEVSAIAPVVRALRTRYPRFEILVVDDGSTDDTARIAAAEGAVVVRHHENHGYGSTWKTGVAEARAPVVVFFDGDGQMDVEDVERLLAEMRATDADMVSGARRNASGSPLLRRPGKELLRRLAQFLVSRKIADLNCGLRAIKVDVLRRYLHLLPQGFSASTTSLMVFMQRGYLVKFVPITVRKRVGSSTVRIISDGFGTLMLILRLIALFNPMRVFLPISLGTIALSLIYSLVEVLRVGLGIPVLGAIMFIGGLQFFLIGIVCDQVSALRLERFEGLARRSGPAAGQSAAWDGADASETADPDARAGM
ncbi:MAG: glycosyltransferase family 2 protein [Gammaproteobacteria bacterium]|nr:glycosyltransferase family 2 protein [Gammaproteobacteria bacterium]